MDAIPSTIIGIKVQNKTIHLDFVQKFVKHSEEFCLLILYLSILSGAVPFKVACSQPTFFFIFPDIVLEMCLKLESVHGHGYKRA